LSNIILGKIKPYIEKVMGEYENGFRDVSSVIGNIFALKIVNKKLKPTIIETISLNRLRWF
jgi:hypothetical protein